MEQTNYMKTGTTTLAVLCKDGVVLGADKRATAGHFIADNKAKKVHEITKDMGVTIAGTVSDAQLIIKLIKANIRLKDIQTRRKSTVKEAANFLSGIIYNNIRKFSTIPGVAHFLLGGKDGCGFHIYDVFADGSLSEIDDFVSSGSGSVMAYGVLEGEYKKGLSVEEGVKLVTKCLNSALRRDSASGSGIQIITITDKGFKEVVNKDLTTNI
jgi:proteasome beta subunit